MLEEVVKVSAAERKKFSSPPEFRKLWQNDFTSTPLAGSLNCVALLCCAFLWVGLVN